MRAGAHWFVLPLALAAVACSRPEAKHAAPAATQTSAEQFPPPAYEAGTPPELRPLVEKTFTGDLDAMVQRRLVRIGAPFNRTFYFIDHGVQRGLAFEYSRLFEDQLNAGLEKGGLRVHVVLIPMPHDALLPALVAGKLDMVVAQTTVTPERQKLVDFSIPTRTNVNEILVTGPSAAQVTSLDDLRDAKVFVRRSSSYFASLEAYNRQRTAQGKASVRIEPAPESLEDDDLLEMVNAGLVPATVVDNYLAAFWKQVLPNLTLHEDQTVRTGASLAVAFRKGSPQLASRLNAFLAQNGLSSVFGRTIGERYLQSTKYVMDAASVEDRRKFLNMEALFRKYGDEYSFDYLLMAAQAYQESRLDQNAKSHVGAIGVMQLMPKTGEAQGVGDIHTLDPNIHAGVKYMRFMRDQYFERQPMSDLDKGLFTFAAYNAGAGRIGQLRREAASRGLNPNVWFGNVERIASERIGRETVTYVSSIYKYYLAYRLVTEERRVRKEARQTLQSRAAK